uniref:Uncharacterized protein n=1 Tax=uncultured prokaryote TaxID=198431 RepID=A0A0H5PZX3_9ZZZZ|nr:hypothetical protein [uncultured prokaryote]
MSREQAEKRAQEMIQKALAEAEKGTYKIDRSLQGKHIVTKYEIAEKKKEEKRIAKEMRRSAYKPAFLVSLAGIFEKILHTIVTLFTMAIVVNILFVWQIYKAVSAGGWLAIFHTKYTLYMLAYFALLFILNRVYYQLYLYAHD